VFPFGSDLGAADKVALRDDADQLSGLVYHWKAADVFLQHDVGRLDNWSCGRDGNNLPCHDLMRAHFTIS
jgi:hypothetical protein